MPTFFNGRTFLVMFSALALTVLCISPIAQDNFLVWMLSAGASIADTLFHELGHTIFSWLFGCPAIPMIFTLFGADQAGGLTMYGARNWFLQGASLVALAYGCRCFYGEWFFRPLVVFTALIALVAATGKYEVVVTYMGHGTSIFVGGYFLYCAWLDIAESGFKRWLYAFFGFFLILRNLMFSYGLAFSKDKLFDYVVQTPGGSGHHDFLAIELMVQGWSVKYIALFTVGYCVVTLITSLFFAIMDDGVE